MHRTTIRGLTAAVTALLCLAPLALRPAAAQAATQVAVYPGLVLRGIASAVPVGVTDPARTISIGVALQHPDPAGEAALVRDMYKPGTADYHHFLSPDAFAARFGVPQSRLDATVAWLQGGGLRTVTVPGTGDYVLASGTVAQVGQLLSVPFRDFVASDHLRHYANTKAPTAPATLGIAAIAGLNDVEGPQLNAKSPAKTHRTAIGPNTNINLTTPQDLWDIYQQPAQNRGSGQSMAIFGWGVTDGVERDLRFEEKEFGLPGVPLAIKHYGTENVTDTGGAGEWRLDTQASTAMAPDVVGEHLYFGNAGTDPDLIAAYLAWANDRNGPLQGSSSFGGCEEAPGTDALQSGGPGNPSGTVIISNTKQDMYTAALRQAVLEGRTMFASTGDTGSSCPVVSVDVNGVGNEVVPLLGFPAASPYAVAVGGTVLYWDGGSGATPAAPATRALEYAWPFTGGGTSAFLAAGDYQQSVLQIAGHCIVDNHGNPYSPPAPQCRGVPDVAAQSGDGLVGPALLLGSNGFSITSDGANDQAGGGTSLSSPLWLGMWTRIQAASTTGTGFADPAIYSIGNDATKGPRDFNDIIAGANGYYTALPGWDYVSGWGTPNVTSLMRDVDGRILPVHPVTPAPVVRFVPPKLNPCGPLWTSPAGSDSYLGQTGQNPQLDLLSGTLRLLPDHKTLRSTLVVNDLSKTVPPGGANSDYYMLWAYKGVQWFSHVSVDPSGTITYSDGQVNGNIRKDRANDTGQFNTGKNGTVVVDVPLSVVGNPPLATILTSPTGETDVTVGAPGVGGLLETADIGGPDNDFQIGQLCIAVATSGTVVGFAGGGSHNASSNALLALPNTSAGAAQDAAEMVGVILLIGAAHRRRRRRVMRAARCARRP